MEPGAPIWGAQWVIYLKINNFLRITPKDYWNIAPYSEKHEFSSQNLVWGQILHIKCDGGIQTQPIWCFELKNTQNATFAAL